jgi:CRISPR-associated protein Cas1
MGKTRYIFSFGELRCSEYSIDLNVKDKKPLHLPIKDIDEIYCMNEIGLNTKLLNICRQEGIILHFFGYYGQYVGSFYPAEKLVSGRIFIKQVEAYNTKREIISRAIVKGIGINIVETLYHYYRHGTPEVKETVDWIKETAIPQLDAVHTIAEIMMIEGMMWDKFYKTFKYFVPEDFIFNKRVRRPPDNPMNAMISFGNTLLYTKTISVIYSTVLNQQISFLHEPSDSRFSLCLDMCEVFKPLIVFKTIFKLVNNKQITVNKHFDKKLNYCILNDDGKKIFVNEFEKRLDEVIMHSSLNRKVSYRSLIKYDCYKLIKYILENKEFVPYSAKINR